MSKYPEIVHRDGGAKSRRANARSRGEGQLGCMIHSESRRLRAFARRDARAATELRRACARRCRALRRVQCRSISPGWLSRLHASMRMSFRCDPVPQLSLVPLPKSPFLFSALVQTQVSSVGLLRGGMHPSLRAFLCPDKHCAGHGSLATLRLSASRTHFSCSRS
jgi:hypothetical protein